MNPSLFKLKVQALIREVDGLGVGYKFTSEDSQEELLNLKESIVISLDDIEDLIEGDEALKAVES